MASGPLSAGGGAGEKHRWADSKVYTRKAHRNAPKSNPNPPPQPPQEQPQQQKPSPETLDAANSPSGVPPPENRADAVPGAEDRENGAVPMVSHRVENGELHRVINFAARSASEARELQRKLAEELEQVRDLIRKLEAREQQQQVAAAAVTTTIDSHSQFLGNDVQLVTPPKRPTVNSDQPPPPPPSLHRQLSVSVASGQMENHSISDVLEKEKRTPKANQFYRSSDFITGKDRFPLSDSHKKSKANGSRKNMDGIPTGMDRFYVPAFKSCSALLTRLMKHKHGWVFNTPVDVKGLGLYDYHLIIKHPMDLGTVKTRLNNNWYKSPREFAEDVRLTFHNAMTYNPKGQDVHIMAEQLLKIFEEKWPSIEVELSMPSYPIMPKKVPPPPLDMRRILERSDSTAHQVFLDSTPKVVSYTPHSARTPALKKPKAKDINKRDMTFDEKQKLSNNLQSLPSEKLDIVVQIIKKRNSSLHQHNDEIEVDIDSVDTETLWELDRFVTNYKKSLSKHKRKAELAFQAKLEAEKNAQKLQSQGVVVGEVPAEGKTDEKNVGYSSPGADKAKGDNESVSTSSSSSSSDSGSSSSDSDSESSSS